MKWYIVEGFTETAGQFVICVTPAKSVKDLAKKLGLHIARHSISDPYYLNGVCDVTVRVTPKIENPETFIKVAFKKTRPLKPPGTKRRNVITGDHRF